MPSGLGGIAGVQPERAEKKVNEVEKGVGEAHLTESYNWNALISPAWETEAHRGEVIHPG